MSSTTVMPAAASTAASISGAVTAAGTAVPAVPIGAVPNGDRPDPTAFSAVFGQAIVRATPMQPDVATVLTAVTAVPEEGSEPGGEPTAETTEPATGADGVSSQVLASIVAMAAPQLTSPGGTVALVQPAPQQITVDASRTAIQPPAPVSAPMAARSQPASVPDSKLPAQQVSPDPQQAESRQAYSGSIETVQSVDAEAARSTGETGGLSAQVVVAASAKSQIEAPVAERPAAKPAPVPASSAAQAGDPRPHSVQSERTEQIPEHAVIATRADRQDTLPAPVTVLQSGDGTRPQILSVKQPLSTPAVESKPIFASTIPEEGPEILFDIRHTEQQAPAAVPIDPRAEPGLSTLPAAQAGPESLPTVSSAASTIAAVSPDVQQPTDRNVAMERSTKTSLGIALAGSSEASTADEAAPHRESAEHEGDRPSPERKAQPTPALEHRFSAAGVSPVESPLTAGTAASTAPTASPRSLERIRIVEQVTQKLDTMRLTNGRQEVTIHLRPDHLGDLRLTIVADRNDVVTRVVAETTMARDAVNDGREQLRASLEQKGYTLQGLDVSLGSSSQQSFAPYDRSEQRPQNFARPAPTSEPNPSSAAPSAAPRTGLRTSAGRLDYEA